MGRGRASDQKFRQLIVKKILQWQKIREIADELCFAKSTVGDILKHYRETGNFDVKDKARQKKVCSVSVCYRHRPSILSVSNSLYRRMSDCFCLRYFVLVPVLKAVKFCFRLGKNAAETVLMLKTAYKDDAMGKTQVYEWFVRFKNGDMSIDDKPRSGRPSTARNNENVEKIRELVLTDRRQTID
ncbi:hypothetical protein NQ318_014290 [Aromia moschata]|uniref:Mos1 transposase HTH domain-containing protein n=1 Tax=Aromia moschata TaxID=1265417 RepID=A0AAV8YXY2_9CUCU|nr:hypothetical protein NQ318_014290 [Aromia moschata]